MESTGRSDWKLILLKAVELNLQTFDPMLVKPKCVWEAVDFLGNCKHTAEKFS